MITDEIVLPEPAATEAEALDTHAFECVPCHTTYRSHRDKGIPRCPECTLAMTPVAPRAKRIKATTLPIPRERSDGTCRVVRLTAENVKRLSAVTIAPDGDVVVIGGANGAGKSSVLDSIEMALAGKRSYPDAPVRTGADGFRIVLDLDGLRVTRTTTSLRVERANGDRPQSPQSILDDLYGRLSFDPSSFLHAKNQVEILRQITGLDTTAIDNKRSDLYAMRTAVGRARDAAKARLATLPTYLDAPSEEVSVSEVARQLQAAHAAAHAREQLGLAAAKTNQDRVLLARTVARLDGELQTARAQLAAAEQAVVEAQASQAECAVPDVTEIQCRLACAEDSNAQVRANRLADAAASESRTLSEQYDKLSTEIDALDESKRAAVAAAKMPIDGLSLYNECVNYKGVPLAQASQAEALRVSLAIGAALHPKLRVLLVRDASLLDEASMALVRSWAQEHEYQVWLERVGTGDAGAVVIEDGAVAS